MDTPTNQPFCINDWHIDPSMDCISRDGATVRLEPKHMQVLLLLAQHAGEIVSIRRIEDAIWGDAIVSQNALHQAVAQLRRSLEDEAKTPRYIQTVSRRGYRLIARVRAETAPVASDVVTSVTAEPRASTESTTKQPDAPLPSNRQGDPSPRRESSTWGTAARSHWKQIALITGLLMVITTCMAWARLEAAKAAGESARADAVSAFMLKVFSPSVAPQQPTARQLADDAVQRIVTDLKGQPALQAKMLETIASSYLHSESAERAVVPYQEALRIRRQLGSQREIALTLRKLGEALRTVFRTEEAESAFMEALKIHQGISGDRDADYAALLSSLGALELTRGRPQTALDYLKESLELARRMRGEYHSEVAAVLSVIGAALLAKGELDSAERVLREAIGILRIAQPELNPFRVIAHQGLSEVLEAQGRMDDAADELEIVLEGVSKIFGPETARYAAAKGRLAMVRFSQNQVSNANRLSSEAIEIYKRLGKSADFYRSYEQTEVARRLLISNHFTEADQLLRDSVALLEGMSSPNHVFIARAEHILGESLVKQGKLADAETVLKTGIDRLQRISAPQWMIERCVNALGEALYRQGRIEEGRRMIIQSRNLLFSLNPSNERSKKKAEERMQWLSTTQAGKR